jgi:hypothetical protein
MTEGVGGLLRVVFCQFSLYFQVHLLHKACCDLLQDPRSHNIPQPSHNRVRCNVNN